MAGAWEIRHSRNCLVGVLHVDVVSTAWSLGLRNLQVPGVIMPVCGMPYDHARNTICQQALNMGVDYVFMLDSDVIPPPDAILRLMAHNKPVISGVYHRRSPPEGVPVMIRGGQWVTQYPANKIIEVDYVGAGCLLIATDVLRRLPPSDPARGKHWFDWRVDVAKGPNGEGGGMSEDFTFCANVKRHLGIPILCDTSIQCRHVGLGQATYGSFKPCEVIPA